MLIGDIVENAARHDPREAEVRPLRHEWLRIPSGKVPKRMLRQRFAPAG